ncbi:MAG: hypothetical protein PHN90_05240 [Methanothrix sp.]|jgi:hypothetical protein|nr:hypothetical protein [Methanothrix sp.]OPX82614.1 MAG: hypothetical protein A4E50_00216 [Methanosaeta sp. PtaB.Bin087]OPY50749.1 MAG: hypothetical protein A4E51_01683 [Methanosaeta sp. PtaU1.Bin055]NLX39849.1 hypothetical protein [Methanothrix sp.]HOI68918.1 hypothetical protein [Methanothrix sp.]
MMHSGDRIKGGDMPTDLIEKVDGLLDQFMGIVESLVEERRIQRGIVRSQNPSSMVAVLDQATLYILAQNHAGALSTMYTYHPDKRISEQKAISSARWEFGYEDPLMIVFPAVVLDEGERDRREILRVIAIAHVEAEIQRAINLMSLMQIRPLFGHASYIVDDRTASVILPLTDDGDDLYDEAVKPALERAGLVPRRALDFGDDEEKLKAIWREICRARMVVADLTGTDPLVMYELGIAHTIGKESLVLCRRGTCPRFPGKLIRANFLEYDGGEDGLLKLRAEMAEILHQMMNPVMGSD